MHIGTAQRKRQVRRVWVRVRVTARAGAGARVDVRGSGRGEGEVSVRVKVETGWSATTVDGHVEVASRVRGRLQRQPLGRRLRHRLCGRERRHLSLVVGWRRWSFLDLSLPPPPSRREAQVWLGRKRRDDKSKS